MGEAGSVKKKKKKRRIVLFKGPWDGRGCIRIVALRRIGAGRRGGAIRGGRSMTVMLLIAWVARHDVLMSWATALAVSCRVGGKGKERRAKDESDYGNGRRRSSRSPQFRNLAIITGRGKSRARKIRD